VTVSFSRISVLHRIS